ncbi:MAG: hypothetical protein ACO1O1_02445 [Adhaeribacter sp.]
MGQLKFIGRQLIILFFITGIINVYAFEYWCNIRPARITGAASAHDHGPAGHGRPASHAHPAGHDHDHDHSHNSPGQEPGSDAGCCKDDTARFFASLQAPGSQSWSFVPGELPAVLTSWLAGASAPVAAGYRPSPEFFPDIGLKPKIPDIRIYICSLII